MWYVSINLKVAFQCKSQSLPILFCAGNAKQDSFSEISAGGERSMKFYMNNVKRFLILNPNVLNFNKWFISDFSQLVINNNWLTGRMSQLTSLWFCCLQIEKDVIQLMGLERWYFSILNTGTWISLKRHTKHNSTSQ